MTIAANVVDGVLTLAGDSETESGRYVYVGPPATVVDGVPNLLDPDIGGIPGGAFFFVPVEDDGSEIVKIDATGVTGAGVEIEAYDDGLEILGSQQGDIVLALADALDIKTNGGDDLVLAFSGFAGAQSIDGGAGADTIYAGDGDDVLIGGDGADIINGEDGFDVAAYSGVRDDYEITVENGAYVVRDLREGAPDGVDRIARVERLQFSDGALDLAPLGSGLSASVAGGTFTVSGAGLSGGSLSFASDRVVVSAEPGALLLRDGGDLHPEVDFSDDGSDVRIIDVRGVTGVGVDILAAARALRIFGSEQADDIVGSAPPPNGSRGVFLGHGGDDTITGLGEGNLYLGGGDGDDSVTADDGADTLIGNRGDDTLDGGDGIDVALYSGNASDYVVAFENGAYTVTDLRSGKDGADVLYGVEQLQFDDALMSLDAMEPPTDLAASLSAGVLAVSGAAAWTDEFVLIRADDLLVRDNGDPRAEIAVADDGSIARTVDARGVTVGGGVDVTTNIKSARVFGSEQADYIEIGGAGRNVAMGGGGDDTIEGYVGRDELLGGDGDDFIVGLLGNDLLTGGRGDDTLDGGSGADVAVYSGARSNYLIEQVYDYYRVTDLRAGYNGTDLIVDVEQLRFKDGLFDVETLVAPPPADDALIA